MKHNQWTGWAASALVTATGILGGCGMPQRQDPVAPIAAVGQTESIALVVKPPTLEEYKQYFASPELTARDMMAASAWALNRASNGERLPFAFLYGLENAINARHQQLPEFVRNAIGSNYWPATYNDNLESFVADTPEKVKTFCATMYWQSVVLNVGENPVTAMMNKPQIYKLAEKYSKPADRVKFGLEKYDTLTDADLYPRLMSNLSTGILNPAEAELFLHTAARLMSCGTINAKIVPTTDADADFFGLPKQKIIAVADASEANDVRLITWLKNDGSKESAFYVNGNRVDLDAATSVELALTSKPDKLKPIAINADDAKLAGMAVGRIVEITGYSESKSAKMALYYDDTGNICSNSYEDGKFIEQTYVGAGSAEAARAINILRRIERSETAISRLSAEILQTNPVANIHPRYLPVLPAARGDTQTSVIQTLFRGACKGR